LTVGDECFLIDIDISMNKLKRVYKEIEKTAKEMVNFIEEETELRIKRY
jgi:hypothetical protein